MIYAGELNHRITIQMPKTVKVNGVSATTWITFKTVSASIKQLRGFNLANANAVWPGAEFTIGFHYLYGVKANMRVIDESGMIYSILGPPNDVDGKHREIELTCQSGVKVS